MYYIELVVSIRRIGLDGFTTVVVCRAGQSHSPRSWSYIHFLVSELVFLLYVPCLVLSTDNLFSVCYIGLVWEFISRGYICGGNSVLFDYGNKQRVPHVGKDISTLPQHPVSYSRHGLSLCVFILCSMAYFVHELRVLTLLYWSISVVK